VYNERKLQEKQVIPLSKSNMAAVCYGPSFLLEYLIISSLLKKEAKNFNEFLHYKGSKISHEETIC